MNDLEQIIIEVPIFKSLKNISYHVVFIYQSGFYDEYGHKLELRSTM